MSEGDHTTLVAWQGDPALVRSVFENVLSEAKRSRLFEPVVIEAGDGPARKADPARGAKRTGPDAVPWTSVAGYLSGPDGRGKRKPPKHPSGKEFFVVVPSEAWERACAISDFAWVFIAPDATSPNFIYRLLAPYVREGARRPTIAMWYLGIDSIEEAAREHLAIAEQIARLVPGTDPLLFAGHIPIDPGKMELAKSRNLAPIDMFPGDSFHGSIKAGLSRAELRRIPGESGEEAEPLRLRKALLAFGDEGGR
jgi:hypothetical protein